MMDVNIHVPFDAAVGDNYLSTWAKNITSADLSSTLDLSWTHPFVGDDIARLNQPWNNTLDLWSSEMETWAKRSKGSLGKTKEKHESTILGRKKERT